MIRNRRELFEAIQTQLDEAADESLLAIVMLRVQGLHELSLRFGYEQGEQAQATAALVIAQALRPVDRVFCIGSDRFVLVLPRLRHRNHVLLATARLGQAFEQMLAGAASPWQGRPSMGVALAPEHGNAPDQLCRLAGIALEDSQRRGVQCTFSQPQTSRVEIVYDELRNAIGNNLLEVYFQPLWDLRNGCLAGVESLARWTSPVHGPISPVDFVPFAEESDLIFALTRWSINATLRHAASLRHVSGLTFAINLSPRVFNHSGMVEQLFSALEIWNVSPTVLVVEVTETALMNDMHASVNALRRLRDHGIGVSIDDFGTGYASISYLRRLPATELKLDQSLIFSINEDVRTAKLVRALIDMAHHLDLTTIAEGIETEAVRQLLTAMGCDYGQGYYLGHPEPAGAFTGRFPK